MVKTIQSKKKSSSLESVSRLPRNLLGSIWGLGPITVCSNNESGLTVTDFTPKSNSVTYVFAGEKVELVSFSKTIVPCEL